MDGFNNIKEQIANEGFAVVKNIFTEQEINDLLLAVSQVDMSKPTIRKSSEVFAIRQFFKEVPAALNSIFNNKLNQLIAAHFGDEFFVVKAIYFDKPENSNWFVAYHQDLTISVDNKIDIEEYGPWTVKHNQFAVQPPISILQDNFTIRIHLDDTNNGNGALKVVPGSHLKGIYRPETIDWTVEKEIICDVPKGGIMVMKPLLLHSSGRTANNNKRRVIHIEFSRSNLPGKLKWAELIDVQAYQS